MTAPASASDAALSDLGRARDERGIVVGVERHGAAIVELTVVLPHLAEAARPGEFAQLRCADGIVPLLRRPMSVAWTHADRVAFVLEPAGAGTSLLAAMRAGDELDVLGPLGNGFTIPAGARRVVAVAGGLGCAPFPLLAAAALRAGVAEVVVLHGAATAARLFPAEGFRRGAGGAVRVLEATDDGSRGHHGSVLDLVGDALVEGAGALYACGPNPMLVALAALPRRSWPAIAEASLEAPMGCGYGTCLGCALPVRGAGGGTEWALCCRRGPVMPVAAVDWEAVGALPPPHVA